MLRLDYCRLIGRPVTSSWTFDFASLDLTLICLLLLDFLLAGMALLHLCFLLILNPYPITLELI